MKMPKIVKWLIIGMAINITGASFLWPLNTIYMNEELNKSLSTAGVVLMINAFGSVVGNLMGGSLFDKIGGFRSIIFASIINIGSLVGLNFLNDWPWYPFWLVILGFGGGIIVPAIYAMAAASWPNGGRTTFNAIYLAQNLGVSIGAAAGGFVADFSFKYIFMANLLLYVVFIIIALRYYNVDLNVNVKNNEGISSAVEVKDKKKFKALILLCVMFSLCWIGYVQWQTTIATYTQSVGISLKQYSLLWTVNGVLILAGQPLIAPFINRFKERLKLQMGVGLGIFIVSYLVTSVAEQFTMFVVGMVILTFGEMFVWPAVPAIANKLAPKGRMGAYQGIVNASSTVGKAFGPVVGGVIVDVFDMKVMFFSMIALILVGYYFLIIYDKGIKKGNVA
ncbi:MDR family MFS transporter [Mammaliicoccus lentus]|uniref:MDR family MFS transporter n=1 Tax=Mammaliicoccus lentus TaxID=42858 RepID=UPI001B336FCF|nr:MFS transporter [Mammaliicoccus lentus]